MELDGFSLAILVILAGSFAYAFFWIMRVKRNGIETQAVVTRMEEHEDIDSDGMTSTYYDFFVRYRTEEGRTVEVSLANPKNRLMIGNRVMIRYLPGREDYPVLMKILE